MGQAIDTGIQTISSAFACTIKSVGLKNRQTPVKANPGA